jgi:diaminopimelate decarboxylase
MLPPSHPQINPRQPATPKTAKHQNAVEPRFHYVRQRTVLARRVRVGRLRALRVGDLVAFGLAGAYAWNISHHGFLMHPPPAFHCLA